MTRFWYMLGALVVIILFTWTNKCDDIEKVERNFETRVTGITLVLVVSACFDALEWLGGA